MPHLVVSISCHGFGHVAQTAPILNLLHVSMPQLRLTVRSSVPLTHLRSRIRAPFTCLPSSGDIGMVMHSALDVDAKKSRSAYNSFHADWGERVADEARLLHKLGADMVLSNVGYLPLAGAQLAGIPNIALCSLNWFDIYRHYCGNDAIAMQMHECYAGADAFLRATPGMAMEHLPNIVCVAPIAAVGIRRRNELERCLGLANGQRMVLVSMGGIDSRLPVERWPCCDGVRWLVPGSWRIEHPGAIVLESLPMNFSDLLASCDALLCKPGYGSFVEAACSATPVLYVNRAGWPESSALVEWLKQNALCREISRDALERGNISGVLEEIWSCSRQEATVGMPSGHQVPEGVKQAAEWIAKRLQSMGWR